MSLVSGAASKARPPHCRPTRVSHIRGRQMYLSALDPSSSVLPKRSPPGRCFGSRPCPPKIWVWPIGAAIEAQPFYPGAAQYKSAALTISKRLAGLQPCPLSSPGAQGGAAMSARPVLLDTAHLAQPDIWIQCCAKLTRPQPIIAWLAGMPGWMVNPPLTSQPTNMGIDQARTLM